MKKKQEFYESLLDNRKPNTLLNKLYEKPKSEKYKNSSHFQFYDPNIYHQADLLVLPNDKGYQYLLVVVDVGTRLVDAVPLKSKTSAVVGDALETIYNRKKNKILDHPKFLVVDNGTEFRGSVPELMDENDTLVKRTRVGRHRQNAIVERKNQTIGTLIHKKITNDELVNGNASSAWVDDLPAILNAINKNVRKSNSKHKDDVTDGPPRISTPLLSVGTHVRVIMEEPHSIADDDKLHGKFRNSDIRWNREIHQIENILMKPDQPPMYIVSDIPHVGYTRNQLQIAKPQDALTSTTKADPTRFEVEKILNRRKNGKAFEYLIKWKGYAASKATWEKRKELIKEIPQLINNYDKKNE
jgi:hypothetical protein